VDARKAAINLFTRY